jgi:hypothetical protein
VRRATNGSIARVTWELLSGRSLFTCGARPFIEDTLVHSNDSPHCCLRKRKVHTMVNFDLVRGWLELCDGTMNIP